MTLSDKLYKILIKGGSWKTILGGLWVTIRISFFALLMGTVLGALVMLEKPDAGQIVIDGQEITAKSARKLTLLAPRFPRRA